MRRIEGRLSRLEKTMGSKYKPFILYFMKKESDNEEEKRSEAVKLHLEEHPEDAGKTFNFLCVHWV